MDLNHPTNAQSPEWAEKIKVVGFKGVEKFYDILPLLADAETFSQVVEVLADLVDKAAGGDAFHYESESSHPVDLAIAIEARGFVFGSVLAWRRNLGLVLARKPGHTPGNTSTTVYDNEYGKDTLEVQCGLIPKGAKVLIVDDLVATGGTAKAVCDMVKDQGGEVVGVLTLIELTELGGRKLLEDAGYELFSALQC